MHQGGPVDILIRDLARELGQKWETSVAVLNKTGVNEIIAADFVAPRSVVAGWSARILRELAMLKLPASLMARGCTSDWRYAAGKPCRR